MTTTMTLERPLAEAATPAEGPGRLLIQIMTPGWGASGYYGADVIEQAAKDRVFRAGTHMYLDHPTATEAFERPVRSVKDLSAVLVEDARWDPARKALVAEARVFSQWRQPIADMAESIGVSIRADADVEDGEAEGRSGRIVKRLVEAKSIDFVTRAGRDGRVLEVLEAAREVTEARNVAQWVEARIHADFTRIADDMFGDGRLTRDERITLSSAIGDALAAFVARVEADAPALYGRDLWDEPPTTPATAQEAESRIAALTQRMEEALSRATKTAPTAQVEASEAAPAAEPTQPATEAGTTPPQQKEDPMGIIQVDEARYAGLEEKAGLVPALEQRAETAEKRAKEAEQRALQAEAGTYARDFARNVVTKANADLAEASVTRIVRSALAQPLPLTEAGRLDTEKFAPVVEEARKDEETYLAQVAEASGIGSVRGVGASTGPTTVTEADADRAVSGLFRRDTKEA